MSSSISLLNSILLIYSNSPITVDWVYGSIYFSTKRKSYKLDWIFRIFEYLKLFFNNIFNEIVISYRFEFRDSNLINVITMVVMIKKLIKISIFSITKGNIDSFNTIVNSCLDVINKWFP